MAVTKANFSYCLTKDGTYIEIPAQYIKAIKQSNESLASEDSGRSDDGVMHVSWIKHKLRKWEIEFVTCPPSAFQALFNAIQGNEYYVNIYDVTTNTYTTDLHVYTSNTESDCYSGILGNGGLYQGVSFSIIECGD